MRVVHLPCYDDNPYQALLMEAQAELGIEAIAGGGGGNFLRSALFRWQARVLHFHWLHPYMLRSGWTGSLLRSLRFSLELLLIRLAGKRLIWTLHNLANHETLHPGLERKMLRLTLPLFHAVICHSEFAKSQAMTHLKIPANRLHVIPHPNYLGQYPNDVSTAQSRAELGLADDQRVLLFLGRVAAYKGVGDLVRAFRIVALPQDVLVIAGTEAEPNAFTKLAELAGGDLQIRLLKGFVPDHRLQTYFAAADVVVFPFRQVLTSGSVVLAMGFGKACIAPRLGGIAELGLDNRLLFDPDDVDSLSGVLENLVHIDLRRVGEQNRKLVQEWTWKRAAEQTLAVYQVNTAPTPHA